MISSISRTAIADSTGVVRFANIAEGTYSYQISYVGLKGKRNSRPVAAIRRHDHRGSFGRGGSGTADEVVVMATRASRTIDDIPTRVETISGEELAEKANMKPGDIRMLLNESTGIQTQQTSATSYNSSIRIQGARREVYTNIKRWLSSLFRLFRRSQSNANSSAGPKAG
jgi:iron complex outermembrane receptor protein